MLEPTSSIGSNSVLFLILKSYFHIQPGILSGHDGDAYGLY
jgi:hypothetical protein